MENTKKEQTANNAECSDMIKQSMIYIFKALKEQGLNNTEKFIDFWVKQ